LKYLGKGVVVKRFMGTFRILTMCALVGGAVGILPFEAGASTPTNGKIAFNRYDVTADVGTAFTIDPDGSQEAMVGSNGDVRCGTWSPDSSKLLCSIFLPTGWPRPATANPDGTGFTVLDAYPGRALFLNPQAWSRDGSRILLSVSNNPDPANDGLYTVRASDGGDLTLVTPTPVTDPPTTDFAMGYSFDGSRILFNRVSDTDQNALYSVGANGTGLVRLSPPRLSVFDPEFFDSVSADWAPDDAKVTFAATWKGAPGRQSSLFVVDADGSGLRQLIPSGLGATSAQWSPDGRLIAFSTKRVRGTPPPQVWVVHPDGSGLTELTYSTNGSISLAPVWSPNGTKLVIVRELKAGHSVWTVSVDGTGLAKLADIPPDALSSYDWGTAPPS
jgi:TolB protein